MNELSPEMLQAILAQQTSEVLLSFMRVEHPSLAEPRRLVVNYQPITRSDGVYQPFAFNAPSPAQKEDHVPGTSITIDNTDLTIGEALRDAVGAPIVTLFTALASHPDIIEEGPYTFMLKSASGDRETITGDLGYDASVFDQNFPCRNYTPGNSPGLHQ